MKFCIVARDNTALYCNVEKIFTELRTREANEITPVRAEHSATLHNDEENYGAGNAIDLDQETYSKTVAGSDGKSWFKITLGKVHCVEKMERHRVQQIWQNWTCTKNNCSKCEGEYCSSFNLSVTTYTEEASPRYLPSSLDCRYGDEVLYSRIDGAGFIPTSEVVILGKQGNKKSIFG